MNLLRAVGVAILRLVDALVPSALTGLVVFFVTVDAGLDAWSPFTLAGGAGALVFVGTLGVGFALTVFGHGPFPVTRATKRVWQWWHRSWFAGRRRGR